MTFHLEKVPAACPGCTAGKATNFKLVARGKKFQNTEIRLNEYLREGRLRARKDRGKEPREYPHILRSLGDRNGCPVISSMSIAWPHETRLENLLMVTLLNAQDNWRGRP